VKLDKSERLKLKGVEILTNVDGQELSASKIPAHFLCKAEQLGRVHHDASKPDSPMGRPDPFYFMQCPRSIPRYDAGT